MKKIRIYSGILIVVALSFGLTGCSGKSGFQEEPRPIKYAVVQSGDAALKKTYSGISKNITESELSFRVPGMIEELPIKIGQRVEKEQMLARLDATDYRTKVNEMEAQFIAAEADLARYRALYEEESATKQELDQAQAKYDVTKARYDLAKQELDYTALTAPDAGQVVSKPVEVHENVSAGQPVCILETGKEMEVKVGLPEYLIGRVKKGDHARVIFKSVREEPYDAAVTEVGVRIDEKTGTFPVTVQIEGHHNELRAGMVVDVKFVFQALDKDSTLIKIPPQAVLEDSQTGKQYVWVYSDETSTVNKRLVTIEGIGLQGAIVESGLENGEIIATAGAHYLEEGQKVRLME